MNNIKGVWIARLATLAIGLYLLTTNHNVFGQGLISGVVLLTIFDFLKNKK